MANVKCLYCGKTFDRKKEEWVIPTKGKRYAHKKCYEDFLKKEKEKEHNLKMLLDYIKKIFNYNEIPPHIFKQINGYIKEYNYTYLGILEALIYFYEVKKGDKKKSNGRLGIVPYVYQDSKNYFYSLWEIQQNNSNLKIDDYIPDEEIISIKSPERKTMGRREITPFNFLEEDL